MKRVLSLLMLLSLAGIAQAQSAAPAPQNVILISWDGLDRSVLKELLDQHKLPNLEALIQEGSRQDINVSGHPTVTKPGHAEMLTGLDTKVTGVVSNQVYQPIPEGYTIFERVQKQVGGVDKIHTFMVTGKIAHVGGRGPGEITPKGKVAKVAKAGRNKPVPSGADDSPKVEKKGEPFYLTKRHLDVFDAAQRDADETGPLCLKYLEQYKSPRFLAFLHFSDPDHAGHRNGSASPEYRQAAVECDAWLGKIVAWLKDQKLYDRTRIYVATDHGFDQNARTHRKAPASWLVTNDKTVTRGGILADIAATILTRFGIDTAKLEPSLIGHSLSAPAPAGAVAAAPASGAPATATQPAAAARASDVVVAPPPLVDDVMGKGKPRKGKNR